ncbi:hypothetical protein BH11CYA1_BH11CYA1_33130 [soil metagenome]
MATIQDLTGNNQASILIVPDIHVLAHDAKIAAEVQDWLTAFEPQRICQTKLGKLSAQRCINGTFSVQVEPSDDEASAALAKELQRNIFVDPSWKQPQDQVQDQGQSQKGFSTDAYDVEALHTAVTQAVAALYDFDQDLIGQSDWAAALKLLTD